MKKSNLAWEVLFLKFNSAAQAVSMLLPTGSQASVARPTGVWTIVSQEGLNQTIQK